MQLAVIELLDTGFKNSELDDLTPEARILRNLVEVIWMSLFQRCYRLKERNQPAKSVLFSPEISRRVPVQFRWRPTQLRTAGPKHMANVAAKAAEPRQPQHTGVPPERSRGIAPVQSSPVRLVALPGFEPGRP